MTGESVVGRRMSSEEIDETFLAFVQAFRSRDREALFAICTPEVQVWHSADRRVKDREEYFAFVCSLKPRNSRFLDVRREYFENGFVQQNLVETTAANGTIEIGEMCLVFKMEHGRISRIDEYSTVQPDLS